MTGIGTTSRSPRSSWSGGRCRRVSLSRPPSSRPPPAPFWGRRGAGRRAAAACFLIRTDFIGSTRVPFWDAELGIESRWMSWDDVRSLNARGFEIGAHTMNHVDLGVVQGAEAVREIVGSRQRLTRELGEETPLFSYPFGRADQMTPDTP